MEQQQDELFAMIGQLTYRLQLAQRENERLADESLTLRENISYLNTEYNTIFTTCNSLTSENAELKARIARIEENQCGSIAMTNEPMTGFHVERDTDDEIESIPDNEIDWQMVNNIGREIFYPQRNGEITDEQMRGFYGETQYEVEEEMTNEEIEWMYANGFMGENDEPYPEWA